LVPHTTLGVGGLRSDGVEIETIDGVVLDGRVTEGKVGSLERLPRVVGGVWFAVEVIEGELHAAEYGEEVVDLLLCGALLIKLQLLRRLSLFLLRNPNGHHPLLLTLLHTIHHCLIQRQHKLLRSVYILFICSLRVQTLRHPLFSTMSSHIHFNFTNDFSLSID